MALRRRGSLPACPGAAYGRGFIWRGILRAVVRQTLLTAFAALTLAAGHAGEADDVQADCVPDPRPVCIDAVVVARIVEYRWEPIPDLGPDVIVMRWPWEVDIEVRHVVLGELPRGRLTIGATLHAGFNERLRQPVFFLTRTLAGGWYLVEADFAARAGRGGYVLPRFDTAHESEVSPEGWLPSDHERWLRPVTYRAGDLGAYEQNWDEEPDGENQWVRISGKKITAKRGFRLADVPAMLEQRRALECRRF
jgi:hypothetical protein